MNRVEVVLADKGFTGELGDQREGEITTVLSVAVFCIELNKVALGLLLPSCAWHFLQGSTGMLTVLPRHTH
eukprot:1160418-Pelagomonas_calceolata.AAC.3